MWLEREGIVRALELRVAPLTGRCCVLYCVELPLLQRLRELSSAATRERAGAPFLLAVEGLELLVDARRAALAWEAEQGRLAAIRRRATSPAELADDARVRALYQRLGRPRPRGRVRLRQWSLEPHSRVLVSGWLREVADVHGEGDYRAAPARMVLQAVRIAAAAAAA
ncbi:MAG: hypothetical protein KC503_43425 [Myxococcales bacterium]|nr:hypothetical protein [Myxococcales bacterium]